MRKTHKQKVKKLQETVLGDALKTPTEYELDNSPIEIYQNGINITIMS